MVKARHLLPTLALVAATSIAACSRSSKPAPEGKPAGATRGGQPAKSAPLAAAPGSQGPAHAVSGDALAQLALDQLGELQKATSLGDWKAAHTGDEITTHHAGIAEPSNREWCARGIAQTTADGDRIMRRTAYFYVPPTPEALAVPANAPDKLVEQCRLGLIWIETADADAKQAATVAADVNQAISANFAVADTASKPSWFNAASWKQNARWKISDVTMVLASTDKPAWKPLSSAPPDATPSDAKPPAGPTRVFVAAAGPASDITFTLTPLRSATDRMAAQHRTAAAHIDEALKIAAREDALEQPMRAFLATFQERAADGKPLSPAERTSFIDALAGWLSVPPDFPAQRRAASLLAADLLLQESTDSAGWRDAKGSPLRKRLQTIGATFTDDPIASTSLYSHSWLKQADRLNAGGRAGELAFLTLMSMGFETSGICSDQGGAGFRAVIQRGEEYLRSNPNASIVQEAHVLIAQAYADIVALADGYAEDYADAEVYKPDAADARKRALEEFKIVFGTDPSSPEARALWPTAWRLAAGLAPTRARFFCVYD